MHLCFDVVAFAGDAAHAVLLPVQRGAREADGVHVAQLGQQGFEAVERGHCLARGLGILENLDEQPGEGAVFVVLEPEQLELVLEQVRPEFPLGGHAVEYRVEAPAELAPFGHQIELMRLADAGGTRKQVKDGLTPRFGIA